MIKIKKTIAVLLAFLFVVSLTAAAVSARSDWDTRNWKDEGHYRDGHNSWVGHWYHGSFYHHHGHWNYDDDHKWWDDGWHWYGHHGHKEKWE
jgi:hypothetical protein